jgi:S-methylmethionine-dependent homocysteine/selenocysteine methylase
VARNRGVCDAARVLSDLLASGAPILADAGLETRIMFETDLELDPVLRVAGLLDDPAGREKLRELYTTDLDVAWAHQLPVILGTATFRASLRHVERAGRGGLDTVRRLNAEAAALLAEIRASSRHEQVLIAGVIGPYGDAYHPADALNAVQAAEYHVTQAETLAEAGVDLLFAAIFPSVDEATGTAEALAMADLPYAISFVLDESGNVLDGTPLAAAIERIDQAVAPVPPTYYSISCVHPHVARQALAALETTSPEATDRLLEVKANGDPLAPEEAAEAADPSQLTQPEEFGEVMYGLSVDFDVPILGGCCGTDSKHLAALARRLEQSTA